MKENKTKIGLIQMTCVEAVDKNEEKAERLVREAASNGAKIVCLQELFNTLYLGQYVDVKNYSYAQPIPSPVTEKMGKLAGEHGIVLIVPVFEEAMPGLYFNTVIVFDADGTYLGKYRKTHIPDGPEYLEKYYFTPGDMGYPVFKTKYGTIAVGICWDEWFPEVARMFALQGAQIIFYPSAIGSEPDRPEYSSEEAWRRVISSHGITNGVFIAAVNRVGEEDNMSFYGGSFLSSPLGEFIAKADNKERILYGDVNFDEIREARELLHFLRDRRVDTYQPLLKKVIE